MRMLQTGAYEVIYKKDDVTIRCSPWIIFVHGVVLRIVCSKDAMHPSLMNGVPVSPSKNLNFHPY
jgi:hypothetical protein